ncbi:hypothetical protein PQE70_gp018 [Bacillus phage vB_BanS_Nate]|uniref:Uncharacterized protein n=1 Tax=Bacillus phage vB_BanS_Nate TaxID=2894788 RepID=A0AAE8YUM7_9CAUD|nr:hypothetical protein PQE70_gp018 [Bacillus phage vB_BanS_Nate]UGO50871.1 hypothetical protein NATE_18 [Bacillus phage vB_BanS_Nate]
MTTVYIKSFDTLVTDVFFQVEISHNGEIQYETMSPESLMELIKRPNVEVTYDEEFESGRSIDQMIDSVDMMYAEICNDDTDGEFDLYLHMVTAKYGEVTYDREGKFIRTYKTFKSAKNRALKLTNNII